MSVDSKLTEYHKQFLFMGANCNRTLFITEATGGLEISISMQFKISKIATFLLYGKMAKFECPWDEI